MVRFTAIGVGLSNAMPDAQHAAIAKLAIILLAYSILLPFVSTFRARKGLDQARVRKDSASKVRRLPY